MLVGQSVMWGSGWAGRSVGRPALWSEIGFVCRLFVCSGLGDFPSRLSIFLLAPYFTPTPPPPARAHTHTHTHTHTHMLIPAEPSLWTCVYRGWRILLWFESRMDVLVCCVIVSDLGASDLRARAGVCVCVCVWMQICKYNFNTLLE